MNIEIVLKASVKKGFSALLVTMMLVSQFATVAFIPEAAAAAPTAPFSSVITDPGLSATPCGPLDTYCFPQITSIRPVGTIAGATGLMQWMELAANGTETVGFRAPDSISSNILWTLPSVIGAASQSLQTDGAGNLNWVTLSSSSTVISLLNGLNSSTQTFATSTDANLKLTVVSFGSTHTYP